MWQGKLTFNVQSNDDYLYTLCLFMLEPGTWARKYGWRALSPLEEHAYYVFWKEIGHRMGIQDIPDSVGAVVAWSKVCRGTVIYSTILTAIPALRGNSHGTCAVQRRRCSVYSRRAAGCGT